MKTSDFDYELPDKLIARTPLRERSASRLLVVDPTLQHYQDRNFKDLPSLLTPQDLLVFNNTKVIPARLYGHKESGGKVEFLLERFVSAHEIWAQLRASKTPKPGTKIYFNDGACLEVVDKQADLYHLKLLTTHDFLNYLEQHGEMPLPPYMERVPEDADRVRYQTIYAETLGAVAAPTAGLHFDNELLAAIKQVGCDLGYLTLHVGAGTFQPVRVANLADHKMHAEYVDLSATLCEQIAMTHARGGRVIAVGTTVVRALEGIATHHGLQAYQGMINLFITPGFNFKIIDALITNFHLPESTLLMLVSAFAGYDLMRAAYQHAIAEQYRFYSYGDAMFISSRAMI